MEGGNLTRGHSLRRYNFVCDHMTPHIYVHLTTGSSVLHHQLSTVCVTNLVANLVTSFPTLETTSYSHDNS